MLMYVLVYFSLVILIPVHAYMFLMIFLNLCVFNIGQLYFCCQAPNYTGIVIVQSNISIYVNGLKSTQINYSG